MNFWSETRQEREQESGPPFQIACGGRAVDITWTKEAPYGQLRYYGPDGAPLSFGVGRTYVMIVPLDCHVTFQ